MASASVAETAVAEPAKTAAAAPARIGVERLNGRTVYTWARHQSLARIHGVTVVVEMAGIELIGSSWVHDHVLQFLALAFAIGSVLVLIERFCGRFFTGMQERLEIGYHSIQIGQGRRGARLTEDVYSMDHIVAVKAEPAPGGSFAVRLVMAEGYSGGAVGGLASLQEAEWLARTVEAEIRARGYSL